MQKTPFWDRNRFLARKVNYRDLLTRACAPIASDIANNRMPEAAANLNSVGRDKMKKKGFTLIELLVVIAIIAMLLAILMPALGKVKKMAERLVCGTNLKGMANALNVYAYDYRDEFPVAGGGGDDMWSIKTAGWDTPSKNWNGDDNLSVAASLFMLVREADVGVKSFVCKSSNQRAFVNHTQHDMTELWDFGGNGDQQEERPSAYVSYSYQIPYDVEGRNYPADGTSAPGNAIMADRNPWYDDTMSRAGASAEEFLEYVNIIFWADPDTAERWQVQVGNSAAHDREGQNVLFGDGHVSFEKRPDVATRYDNIYTVKYYGGTANSDEARRMGTEKYQVTSNPGGAFSISGEDSMLVNDVVSKD